MEPRLRPVNAILGLVTPNDINPAALADAGFSVEGLEIPAVGDDGRSVVIDVLLFNATAGLLVPCESKSGANVEVPQARRYAQLTPEAIVQASQITVQRRGHLSVHVVYACPEEHRDRIRVGLEGAGAEFSILSVGPDKITLAGAPSVPPDLAEPLAHPVHLVGPPPGFIAFDHESPVEIIELPVRAQLIAALSHSRQQVSVPWLAEQAAPHLSLYGRVARNQLVKRVGEAARRIADQDPSMFRFVPPRGNEPAVVKLLRTPEEHDLRGRTQAYQALARSSKRAREATPPQLDLLRELDEAGDAGTDEADGEATS